MDMDTYYGNTCGNTSEHALENAKTLVEIPWNIGSIMMDMDTCGVTIVVTIVVQGDQTSFHPCSAPVTCGKCGASGGGIHVSTELAAAHRVHGRLHSALIGSWPWNTATVPGWRVKGENLKFDRLFIGLPAGKLT